MGEDIERIVALEVRLEMAQKTIDGMAQKVDELHAVFQQARGARWAILAAAGLGGFLAGNMAKLVSFFGK